MSLFPTIALALGASWVSGIRLYAAVAALGLLARFAHLQLPGELGILSNGWIIGIASALYVVEFFADKISYLDTVWDAVHTFIRIPAAAVLAAAALGDYDKGVQVVAFLLGGGLALSSHGTKAVTRATVNASPEPFSNVAVSLGEDVLSAGAIAASVYLPVVACVLVGVGVLIFLLIVPRVLRLMRTTQAKYHAWRERNVPST